MNTVPSSASKGSSRSFRIQLIGLESAQFEDVILLHAKKKATLGPFPRGAFEEHAAKGLILGAIDEEGNKLAGYLLYRRTRTKAAIVHLTRHDEYDGTGVITQLVQRIVDDTKDLLGVSLHCRQDYNLNSMWSAFGFTIRATKPGRGSDGILLDYWWYDHGHEDLFSQAAAIENSTRMVAAIDANVFYDLLYRDRPNHEDTSVLIADWMQDSLELCVTHELYNEIARGEDHDRQEKARRAASGYRELKVSPAELDSAVAKLRSIFGEPSSPRDISDMKQLANAVAGAVPFFVTRDTPMLSRKEKVLELFPIDILHPTSLVNHLDALMRGAAYRPALLEGSSWQRQLVIASDLEEIVGVFKHATEKKGEFDRKLRGYLAHPDIHKVFQIRDPAGCHAVLGVISHSTDVNLEIPLMRHSSHAAAPTIVRHILHDTCGTVSSTGRLHAIVSDPYISNETRDSLEKLGFAVFTGAWHKLSVSGIRTIDEALSIVSESHLPKAIIDALSTLKPGVEAHHFLERQLSPIKIASPEAQAFVVSIKKGWAEQLFAMSFDGQSLLSTDDRLLIGIEGVYYCSAKNRHLRAPSRVLWYVSQGTDGKGPMSVVACSQIEEISCDKPKKIFAQFRNLGVYSWTHVFDTAGHSLDAELMAFRFVRTERFRTPIGLDILGKLGVPSPQNPRKITDEQFASIYRIGMNLPAV